MNYNSREWLSFRNDAINYMKNVEENALRKFLEQVGIKDIFAYDYDYSKNKFTIYTSKPGIWIGYHGKNVEILKEILSKEVKENCEVAFKEIRGRFIVVN